MMRPSEDRLQALRDYYVDPADGAGDVEDLFAEIDALTRERDEAWRAHELAMKAGLARGARAEKAERALGEMREALKRLCESAPDGPWFNTDTKVYLRDLERARSALRPSEEASDEHI